MTSLAPPSFDLATQDGLQSAIWRILAPIPIQAALIRQGIARDHRERAVVIGKPVVPPVEVDGFLALDVTIHGAREDRAAVTAIADEVERRLRGAVLCETPLVLLREHRGRRGEESLSERRVVLSYVAVMPGGEDMMRRDAE